VYLQIVQRTGGRVELEGEPQALSPADAAALLAGRVGFVVGSGATLLPLPAGAAVTHDLVGPDVPGLARMLQQRLQSAPLVDETASCVPLYGRAPDAKLPAARPPLG
jgi:hypothetical protein